MSITETIINDLLTGRLPYPREISVEPVSNMCQLKCPLCPVGARLLTRDGKLMPLETFKAILDKMPFVGAIDLYKSGEPFFHPDIFQMIRYASDQSIKVIISTNFSFSKPELFFEHVVSSGLERLVISLDGASQESYSRYRIGGDYHLVMANMMKLIAAKKRLHSRKPEIIWQFLVNKFNEHEIATAQQIADGLGIALDLRPISLADNEPDVDHSDTIQERKSRWLPENEAYISDCYKGEYQYPLSQELCTQLFTRAVVTVDGKVLPCCEVWDDGSMFGDLRNESFEEIWHGRKYLDARLRFLKKDFSPQAPSVCFRCRNYATTTSLTDKLNLLIAVYKKYIRYQLRNIA